MQTILVVDDDPDVLELVGICLERAGFAVITAATGEDALRQAKSLPDLIVLDLVLPGLDGFTICETLRRESATSSIPVILLTGFSSQLNRLAGLDCGANDYVAKPFTPDELLARVRKLLAQPPQ